MSTSTSLSDSNSLSTSTPPSVSTTNSNASNLPGNSSSVNNGGTGYLPKTGSSDGSVASSIGLATLFGGIGAALFGKRRKEKKENK
ncbi:LPXTG cell wall anchor domain-containing protein [Lactococcus lactis]|nr:LPXTG cell wall anchor domain-containing protein [Lactococcus lactis]UCS91412.1 LPXTG cell wall anchor domain-containing protein [Lactococcus lactis]